MDARKHRPLAGQIALVTGASSGIGAACAVGLGAAGAKVAVNYRSDPEGAAAVVREIERNGGESIAIAADVSREADVLAMFAKAREAYGRLDIVIANAGLQRDAAAAEMTLEQWRQVIDVNLT
ncbi:SDR family NAD(P)-dependent oxidoreductase, partial [Klebsiella pneumoniae]|uniref:SDR family NAD(P)-dependent oxidoreductase n=1 Tax=Klebsiella pneumoniae TaxID=573 RepID=UPI002232AD33